MSDPFPHFIRVTEVARQLGWPLDRVRQMSDRGLLSPRVYPYGRDDYFDEAALRRSLDLLVTSIHPVAVQARALTAREIADQAAVSRGHRGRRRRGKRETGTGR